MNCQCKSYIDNIRALEKQSYHFRNPSDHVNTGSHKNDQIIFKFSHMRSDNEKVFFFRRSTLDCFLVDVPDFSESFTLTPTLNLN